MYRYQKVDPEAKKKTTRHLLQTEQVTGPSITPGRGLSPHTEAALATLLLLPHRPLPLDGPYIQSEATSAREMVATGWWITTRSTELALTALRPMKIDVWDPSHPHHLLPPPWSGSASLRPLPTTRTSVAPSPLPLRLRTTPGTAVPSGEPFLPLCPQLVMAMRTSAPDSPRRRCTALLAPGTPTRTGCLRLHRATPTRQTYGCLCNSR